MHVCYMVYVDRCDIRVWSRLYYNRDIAISILRKLCNYLHIDRDINYVDVYMLPSVTICNDACDIMIGMDEVLECTVIPVTGISDPIV